MAFADLVAEMDRAQLAAFGIPITYQPAEGPPVTPTGIFDANFVLAQGDAPAGVEAAGPAAFFRLSDLPVDPDIDDPTLTIKGSDYRVVGRIRDDAGGIFLTLRRID